MREADVLVVGAGPAGAAAALRLAGRCSVAMLGRARETGRLIGESLPAAAALPLRDLGVWQRFVAQGHRPAWSNTSVWGGDEPVRRDALFDPHGHGWHLDRAAFDALMRDAAVDRGAEWLANTVLHGARHEAGESHPWHCELRAADGTVQRLRCRLLLDASGRAARVVRLADVAVRKPDRLVCLHAWLPAVSEAPVYPGTTLIEACADGWWYSADLPDGGSVLAFHTDADSPLVRVCKTVEQLAALAHERTELVRARCRNAQATAQPVSIAPANSQWAEQAAGAGWLAVGDAALAFDPLASQGLLNGLCTGLQGADHALAHLDGDTRALPAWSGYLQGVRQAYERNLAAYYAMERRWADEPFWLRRVEASQRGRAFTTQ
ncbi:MAG: FAD-dependent monooxygenase [Pseudomonadota bacterium]